MQVYIVLFGEEYEGASVESVWSTSETAEKAADELAREYFGAKYVAERRKGCSYVKVEEHSLDE